MSAWKCVCVCFFKKILAYHSAFLVIVMYFSHFIIHIALPLFQLQVQNEYTQTHPGTFAAKGPIIHTRKWVIPKEPTIKQNR